MRSNKLRLQIVLEMYVMGVVKEKEKKFYLSQMCISIRSHTVVNRGVASSAVIYFSEFQTMCGDILMYMTRYRSVLL